MNIKVNIRNKNEIKIKLKFFICRMPHYFYVNLILLILVVGEYLKYILLQPTRGLFVLFHISRILVQDSTRSWLLLHPLKTIEICKILG